MGVNPHAREFLRPPTEIDLLVEEFGHRIVREGHCHGRADLWDQDEVLDQQQVITGRNPKATNFGLTDITQEQEFRPGCRTEP